MSKHCKWTVVTDGATSETPSYLYRVCLVCGRVEYRMWEEREMLPWKQASGCEPHCKQEDA